MGSCVSFENYSEIYTHHLDVGSHREDFFCLNLNESCTKCSKVSIWTTVASLKVQNCLISYSWKTADLHGAYINCMIWIKAVKLTSNIYLCILFLSRKY
jgi:hypothetical protein